MSENVVSENLLVGKFGVGKIVSENLPSEKLLSEKPPRPNIFYLLLQANAEHYIRRAVEHSIVSLVTF